MSVSTVINIKDRILAATPRSKIAVFRSAQSDCFEALFDNITTTQRRIRGGDMRYIGSYYGNDGRLAFVNDLRNS